METKLILLLFLIILSCSFTNASYRVLEWETKNPAFDSSLYENVLDPAECESQLSYIQRNPNLRLQFIDAGLRLPKFITQGNTLDMGNYYGCLDINEPVEDSAIQGKYCMINIPANQEISFPEIPGFPEFPEGILPDASSRKELFRDVLKLKQLKMNEETMEQVKLFRRTTEGLLIDHIPRAAVVGNVSFGMAVCVPKACTVQEGLNGLFFNLTALGFQYEERFCRLPNDKPWVPADYVAIVIFSLIGLLTILSTLYDLRSRFFLLKEPKSVNPLYTSFSVYTNGIRLTTFSKNPGALDCVDGIRALSMAWVILGHTFSSLPPLINTLDSFVWLVSSSSLFLTSAPLAVDTFFMISGMLLVYTSVGKVTGSKLIKNLHLFYLNRILRMFPMLATAILLQVSFLHWISDGPQWQRVALNTENCRNYWWLNLLYIQNSFSPLCLSHTWYLAIDMQLHILSPILLYFVLSNSKRQAWVALAGGLLAVQTASTIYLFQKKLHGSFIQPNVEPERQFDQTYGYYYFTMTRAAPFLVGMVLGYILHLWRHKPKVPKIVVILLWAAFITLGGLSLYSPEPMKGLDYDNPTLDSFVNAFSRTSWATAIGCLIFLCVNGYGGPVNWLLSLQMWKMPSRISYAMYLLHYPLMFIISGTYVMPIYFSVIGVLYRFVSHFAMAYIIGFFATILIDSPFSTIFKQLLGGGIKKSSNENGVQKNDTTHHHDDPKSEFQDETTAETKTESPKF